MKEVSESVWKEWLGKDRVVKDIGSIRKKGILLEEVLSILHKQYDLVSYMVFRPENAMGYHELYYKGKKDMRVIWAEARAGIPSLVVSVVTQEVWETIRKELRELNLVR